MEKKGNRSVQSSSKGNATELKKSQDVSGGKLWPRNGRRREPPGGAVPTKNELSRKPQPQRNKTVDKRPRPRGFHNSGLVGGKEDPRLDDRCAEVGSVFLQGSKKQSLNHLLNFNYDSPRDWHSRAHAGGKTGNRWLIGTQKHKYNKEQFLQANCQFVVNAVGDYRQYGNNPDALVSWDLIEQVNVQVSDFPSCPICLYPPVAAKMTRCGHIYCWSCVLHYLALSETTWRKCPICYEAVHKQDLKSVVAIPHSSLTVNDHITFRLMKRARGCLSACPADCKPKPDQTLLNMSDPEARSVYSKLLVADKSEILSIIERERRELESAIAEDGESAEKCFQEQAVEQLREREACVLGGLEREVSKTVVENEVGEDSACGVGVGGLSLDDGKEEDEVSDSVIEGLDVGQQPSKYFYFYQASDGQHIYLHALNVRMLEHTYGSLEQCPSTLTGRIVEKEGGSMTEELRKRLRYLQHLPVTCQFEVAEIHLKPPVVHKETLEVFNDQIEIRRKRRQRRAREEKRREKRIADEENRKMGKYPGAVIELESHHQFPEFGFEPSLETRRTESESTGRSDESVPSIVGSWGNDADNGMSFAKMLSSKKPQADVWPGLKRANTSEPPVKLINVTGPKSTVYTRLRKESESDDGDLEGYVPAPVFNQSFGDAIAIALEKASLSNVAEESEGQKGAEGSKKKKRGKQKLLFATTMVYSGK